MKHFESPAAALAFLIEDFVAGMHRDLRADARDGNALRRMVLQNQLADISAIEPFIKLVLPGAQVLIVGDIVDGVAIVGPFVDNEAATTYAGGYDSMGTMYVVADLSAPEET